MDIGSDASLSPFLLSTYSQTVWSYAGRAALRTARKLCSDLSYTQTNKQEFKVSVAAPRQLGRNDQTHRGQTPFPYSTEKETPQKWQKDQHKISSYTLYQEFKPLGINH